MEGSSWSGRWRGVPEREEAREWVREERLLCFRREPGQTRAEEEREDFLDEGSRFFESNYAGLGIDIVESFIIFNCALSF
jgi:hypothetical protein